MLEDTAQGRDAYEPRGSPPRGRGTPTTTLLLMLSVRPQDLQSTYYVPGTGRHAVHTKTEPVATALGIWWGGQIAGGSKQRTTVQWPRGRPGVWGLTGRTPRTWTQSHSQL